MRKKLSALLLFLMVPIMALFGCDKSNLLKPGTQAPDAMLKDQEGAVRNLGSFQGQPLLVYFYPKDDTPGCTTEACSFRDVWERYEAAGIQVVGVSSDSVESHQKFAQKHSLPFPLLADTEHELAEGFGVPSIKGYFARVSFLLDGDGVIREVYPDVDPGVHAEDVLEDVERMGLSS